MNELVTRMMGKEVIIYLGAGNSTITGVIESLNENWISVKAAAGETEVINVDYICRVREHPRNKNGKKKSIF